MLHLINKKIYLFFTDQKKDSKTAFLVQKLENKYQKQIVSIPEEADIIICIGGDGNFLKCVSKLYDLDKYILPIGTGTKNFLLNIIDNIDVLDEEFKNINFPLIEGEVFFNDGEIKKYIAFNDFYMNADYGKMGYLTIKGEKYPQREIMGDGLIVATPAGSTGYNINAGGVVLPLMDNIWSITDINSREKKSHIIENQVLEITINKRGFVGHFDNLKIKKFKKVILNKSKHKIKVLYTLNNDFEEKRYK